MSPLSNWQKHVRGEGGCGIHQPNLKALADAVKYSRDPLDIVNAFVCQPPEVAPLGLYWEHRLCCLAAMVAAAKTKTRIRASR